MAICIGLGNSLELRTFMTRGNPPREHVGLSYVYGSNETRIDLGPLTVQNLEGIIKCFERLKAHAS
jgi:hypothetical protein